MALRPAMRSSVKSATNGSLPVVQLLILSCCLLFYLTFILLFFKTSTWVEIPLPLPLPPNPICKCIGVSSMRQGNYKIILGDPGDHRILAFPKNGDADVPFGKSGGVRENGTNHCMAPPAPMPKGPKLCQPHCLFNVVTDPSESHDLAGDPRYADLIQKLTRRLQELGAQGPPPAFIYPKDIYHNNVSTEICPTADKTGFLEPLPCFPGGQCHQ
eukprot:m.145712 g.145712  ORF g.145712 m.145712 type:complete len:214 (-) comp24284_c1_seq11:60-701(-)